MNSVVYKLVTLITIITAAVYLLSCFSGVVDPAKFWPLTFLALGFPILALLVLILAIAWLFLNKRTTFLLLLVITFGYKNLSNTFSFHTKTYQVNKNNDALRIISWNTRGFDNNAKHAEHPDSIRRKMINFLRQQNADVLLLQEFVEYNNEHIYSNTQMLSDSLGYKYYFASKDVTYDMSYGIIEYGSIIFSKYPLLDTVKLKYTGLALPESAISGYIIFNNKKLRITTTHLVSMNLNKGKLVRTDAAYKEYDSAFIFGTSRFTKLKVYDQLHANQARELTLFLSNFKEPSIISGDLNSVPSSYTYNKMKGNLQDAFLNKGFGLGRTYNSISPTLRIDYLFADKALKISQFNCPQLNLSDHYPVIADVTW